jgi:hypothetical protein
MTLGEARKIVKIIGYDIQIYSGDNYMEAILEALEYVERELGHLKELRDIINSNPTISRDINNL